MKRNLFFCYGVGSYLLFLVIYAYFGAFVGNLPVPKTIDSGIPGPVATAAAVNLLLILGFGLQHSIMARPGFKRIWTRIVPQAIERSTYVFVSNIVLIGLMWYWQPIPIVIWQFTGVLWWAMTILFVAGWLMVPAVSLMINHFDLFGTRQVWLHLRGREYTSLPFRTPMLYSIVRHPLYVGWALFFWATPVMTVGHALFAASLSGYMVIATFFEERDLIAHFGQQYVQYARRVPRFLPWPKGNPAPVVEPSARLP